MKKLRNIAIVLAGMSALVGCSDLNEKILEYFEAFFTKEIASSFISKIYPDEDKIRFSNQKRKFNNFNALRLELDKFGETTI